MRIVILAAFLFLCESMFAQSFVENSVLRDGTLFKVGVVEDGMYRITFDELSAAGVDVPALQLDYISHEMHTAHHDNLGIGVGSLACQCQ